MYLYIYDGGRVDCLHALSSKNTMASRIALYSLMLRQLLCVAEAKGVDYLACAKAHSSREF